MALTNQLGLALAQKQATTPVPTAPAPKAPTPGASSAWTTTNKQTGQVFQNITTGPYTLENARANGYSPEQDAADSRARAAKLAQDKVNEANAKKYTATAWAPVVAKSTNASSTSQFNVPSKGWVVSTTPTTLEGRLDAAKTKYGASDPRVQQIQKLMDLKKSRADNSTWNVVKTPDETALWSKIDTSAAKKGVDEMEVTDRNENLQKDRIDTAADKNNEKVEVIDAAGDKTEKDTTAYKDEYEKEFQAIKDEYAGRQTKLEALEAEQRSKIEAWNKEQNDALANRQMGNQAEATQKLGKLGANDTVMANAQNEIRNNPVYQEQKSKLQKDYIDTLASTTKEYQGMYDNIMKSKTDLTESKRALAEQLLSKINENTEKISTIKQAGVDEMFKPVETFQDKRLEDSNNAELSSKQNSEAQYRWTGMDSSARVAKLKDALYNYDPSISRAWLSSDDFDKAAKEWDITKAVAMLAASAKNLTKANTTSGSGWTSNAKSLATAKTIAQSAISKGYNTLENFTKYLSTQNLTPEQKTMITDAFKQELGWKAPLTTGRTQAEQNADVAAYKAANNIK